MTRTAEVHYLAANNAAARSEDVEPPEYAAILREHALIEAVLFVGCVLRENAPVRDYFGSEEGEGRG